MKKSKILQLTILFSALIMQPLYTQSEGGLQERQKSGYGIEAEKLYSGSSVQILIDDLLEAAESEIVNATSEAYAAGYKSGLLEAKPDAEYWKSKYELYQKSTDSQIKKLKTQRWLFALGGFGSGFLGGGIIGFSVRLQL